MQDLQKAGKYEILDRIGEGGFGVVYQGRDPFIKRLVAIKTCTAGNNETSKRFLREAEIAGSVEHPNLTVLYDFGYEDGVPYLVQEFLSGEDLQHKIKRRDRLSLLAKLEYLRQIAVGLGFAHSQGITHRDVKPSNVRVLDDDRIKIMDFGIAKIASVETQLTQTGTTLGTPAYLSPEQLRGDDVDQRSDIYSYGVMAYELLTYSRPFESRSISSLFYQILNQSPKPLSDHWPECPPRLDAIIARCLEKDATARYQRLDEMLPELELAIEEISASGLDYQPRTAEKAAAVEVTILRPEVAQAREEVEELLESDELDAAEKAIEEASAAFGDSAWLRTLRERVSVMRAGQTPAAGTDYQAVAGSDFGASVAAARSLLESGDLDGTDEALTQCRALWGEAPAVLALSRQVKRERQLRLGNELLATGDIGGAEAALQKAQELDPSSEAVSAALRQLDRTRTARGISPGDDAAVGKGPLEEVAIPGIAVQQPPDDVRPTVVLQTMPAGAEADPAHAGLAGAPAVVDRTVVSPTAGAPTVGAHPILSEEDEDTRRTLRRTLTPMQWAMIAAAAIVVVLLLGVVLRGGGNDVETAGSAGGAAPVMGAVVLQANPWAEVLEVRGANGELMPIEPDLFTPTILELAPGSYRVLLGHPDLAQAREVSIEILPGQVIQENITLLSITAEEYLSRVRP